jgi:hypothetical protein
MRLKVALVEAVSPKDLRVGYGQDLESGSRITQIAQCRGHGHRNHVGESERITRAISAAISTTRADTMMMSVLRMSVLRI